jgi:hypothetical protein
MPDIFLSKVDVDGRPYFEIYVQKLFDNVQKYCLIQTNLHYTVELTNTVPLVQFADMDQDGMVDVVFFAGKSINVLYNLLPAKKYNTGTINDQQNLCHNATEVADFSRIFSEVESADDFDVVITNVETILKDGGYISDKDEIFGLSKSADGSDGRIRLVDLDNDGFIDIALTFETMLSHVSIVLANKPCRDI